LYTTTADNQIAPVPMNPIERWLSIEQARSAGFILNLGRLAKGWLVASLGPSQARLHNGDEYRQGWREFMGDQWPQNIIKAVDILRETILLVRSHHAKVMVLLLPQGTWMETLPFKAQYETPVRSLCAETATPLIDLSHSMNDDEFLDSNHLTVKGQQRFRGLILGIIQDQLRIISEN